MPHLESAPPCTRSGCPACSTPPAYRGERSRRPTTPSWACPGDTQRTIRPLQACAEGPRHRMRPPKELPREVRPFWRRVRSVLEGGAAVGEPRLTGGVGCRGVRGTDLPLSPCATWRGRVSEALREEEHGRRGHHAP